MFFSRRKFIWDKKNIFAINPISSPLKRFINKSVHSSETLAKPNPSLSFVRFTPIFSGYTETVKSITDEENICLDEESYYENIKSKAFANIKLMKECKLMKK